jgi:hypothetical protein
MAAEAAVVKATAKATARATAKVTVKATQSTLNSLSVTATLEARFLSTYHARGTP